MGDEVTPLPVLRDVCAPRCGDCCTCVTPFTGRDVERAVEHLNTLPRRDVERQLRFWGNGPACPFLTLDKKCFIYAARPFVCRVFGHVKPVLACLREAKGEVYFTPLTLEAAQAAFGDGLPQGRERLVAPAFTFARAIHRGLKTPSGAITVATIPALEYRSRLGLPERPGAAA